MLFRFLENQYHGQATHPPCHNCLKRSEIISTENRENNDLKIFPIIMRAQKTVILLYIVKKTAKRTGPIDKITYTHSDLT